MKHFRNTTRAILAATVAASLFGCTEGREGTVEKAVEPTSDDDAPGYIVVQIDAIEDPDGFFSDYADRAGPTLVKHGFVGLVASAEPERLEGEAPDGWTVIIQFPSVEAAQGWYDDPEYVAARPFRIDSVGQTDMVLMRGLAGQTDDLSEFGGFLLEQSERVRDDDGFAAYLERSTQSMAGFGGTVLLEGQPVTLLEGEWPDASTRLVAFPSTESIAQWYGSEDGVALKSARLGSTAGPSLAGFAKFCVPGSEGCE